MKRRSEVLESNLDYKTLIDDFGMQQFVKEHICYGKFCFRAPLDAFQLLFDDLVFYNYLVLFKAFCE
jgi:hypothetical protein